MSRPFLLLFLFAITLYNIIVFFIYAMIEEANLQLFNTIIYLSFLDLIFIFLYFIFPRLTISKKKFKKVENHYEFGESSVRIVSVGDGFREDVTVNYDKFLKTVYNISDIYLFVRPNYAYLLDVTVLTNDQIDFILNNIGKKNITAKEKLDKRKK